MDDIQDRPNGVAVVRRSTKSCDMNKMAEHQEIVTYLIAKSDEEPVHNENAQGEGLGITESTVTDWRLYNIVMVGISFMLIFTAFQTCAMVEESVIEGAKNETNSSFTGDGYTSLAVIYAVFSVSNWAAPSVISLVGPQISMMIGGVTFCLFIASFLKPMTWALYTASALVGFGAAVIWTGQGNFLTINSNNDTVGRNSGIFWALLQCSLLFGNIYIYFAFQGEVEINSHSRTKVFTVLSTTCLIGVLSLLLLRRKTPGQANNLTVNNSDQKINADSPFRALVRALQIFFTKDMLLLSICFAYTGFELTFFSGVYGTSVGHNQHFGSEAKSLLALCGIFIGIGEILGGASFGLFGKRTIKYGRDPIVLLGFVVHMVCFYLIFLNLPANSPLEETLNETYITSNKSLAVSCGFLLGFGDACFNTQVYSILGDLYSEDSGPAFALFKFTQSLAAAGGFFYSRHLILTWQLLILVISGLLGTVSFITVERKHNNSVSHDREI